MMRKFETLDTNSFRAFWTASETLNFTEAAKQASMTQSGISQHVSRLEEQLGVTLFLRVNKRIFLTEEGEIFKKYVERFQDDVLSLKETLTSNLSTLSGQVSYAMPESCLMSPHFSLLLKERRKNFPELELNVSICPSDDVISSILEHKVNFGFVTKAFDIAGIKLIPFCFEEYVLIAHNEESLSFTDSGSLQKLSFLSYPGSEVLFDAWKRTSFPKSKNIHWANLKIAGTMNHLKGIIDMVEHGVGLAVVPKHCIEDQLKKKSVFLRPSSTGHAKNQIYLATLDNEQFSRRVSTVIQTFKDLV